MKKTALAVLLLLTACTGKYIRPTTDAKVKATPEMIARGGYIVNQIGACGACHTPRDGDTMKDFLTKGERTDRFLGGGTFMVIDGIGKLWLPNITPDVETGIGGWTDDEVARAIRDGIHKTGRLMVPMMPFNSYKYMSDDDVASIVAFLRTVPPIKVEKPRQENDLGFMGNFMIGRGVAHHLPAKNVPAPNPTNQIAYGEYVMRLGHCWECHSAKGMSPSDKDEKDFMAGYDEADPILEKVAGKIYMRNLTPDPETGLGKYSADQIKQAIRNGTLLSGKKMAAPMAMMIPHFSGMSDQDLDALVAFLKSLKPVKNKIPDRQLLPEYEKFLNGG